MKGIRRKLGFITMTLMIAWTTLRSPSIEPRNSLSNEDEPEQGKDRDQEPSVGDFDFRVPEISHAYGHLEPMWTCMDRMALNGREKKLIFVHVYKTAGSTIRTLLRGYALGCHAGLAVVVGCSGLSAESIEGGIWRNEAGEKGKRCLLKRVVQRDGKETLPSSHTNTSLLEQHVDILAGHIAMGSHYSWRKNGSGETVDPQYLVFLRDGVHKFVSGILYRSPDISMDEALSKIRKRVADARKHGNYYEKYSTYFLTPEQRRYFRQQGHHLTLEERVNLTMANLVNSNAIIGIVERMPESLELLKHVVDRNGELQKFFEHFGLKSKGKDKEAGKRVINKSVISSSAVVSVLEEDEEFMRELKEYVKYDDQILQFATKLHLRQYEAMKESRKAEET